MDWKHLTKLSGGAPLLVERVRLPDTGIAIEGSFELPALAQLALEDQVFVAAFVRSHGSIKEMERLFGVSYPTIKARLNRLSEALGPALEVDTSTQAGVATTEVAATPQRRDVLDRLERGEITAQQALKELSR
ncbi:MAG TPA: DUF2089 domain-containing protein [Polyangiales bacterium]|jgi:hypothetical protein|nr:DUF2089 domain-containing protein [Polyangiales bacterium]